PITIARGSRETKRFDANSDHRRKLTFDGGLRSSSERCDGDLSFGSRHRDKVIFGSVFEYCSNDPESVGGSAKGLQVAAFCEFELVWGVFKQKAAWRGIGRGVSVGGASGIAGGGVLFREGEAR